MFENIGERIKKAAELLVLIGMITSAVLGIPCFVDGLILYSIKTMLLGLLIAVVGCCMAWILGLLMLGFGRLIENSDTIVNLMQQNQAEDSNDLE